jgi:hypothetical protein
MVLQKEKIVKHNQVVQERHFSRCPWMDEPFMDESGLYQKKEGLNQEGGGKIGP